jgi:hypothetical protein
VLRERSEVDRRIVGLKCVYLSVGIDYDLNMT